MARQATGSIDYHQGRWRLRLTVAGERRLAGTYGTKTEAEAARVAVLAELGRRSVPAEAAWLVADWGERWLDGREMAHVVRYVGGERGLFRAHVAPDPIGKLALRKVTRADVLAWTARLRGKGLATQSVRNILGVLRGALEGALDAAQVRVNVARGIRLPRQTRTEESWMWLPPAELARLVDSVDGPERWLVAFAAGAGLRAGELVALRAADVHEDHVVVRYGGPPKEPTKNGKIRKVPLFGIAADAWRKWQAERKGWACEGEGKANPLGLAFPGRRGGYRSADHVLRWDVWTTARKAAGVPAVRWHDLRHTCASSLVSGVWGRRWSLEEIREVLGHSELSVTQRYAHLSHDAIAQAARETPGPKPY